MISFIVIGYNESINLKRCFVSIDRFSKGNNILTEIIYVDSRSTDNSLLIAKEYKVDHILSVEHPCNAAKARNLGANKAIYSILCFLDGDMEICESFFDRAFADGRLKYDYCTGIHINYYHDGSGNIYEDDYDENVKRIIPNDFDVPYTGGAFFINKRSWQILNGMDEDLFCNEDIDFSFRYRSRLNTKPYYINSVFVYHYTVRYNDKHRLPKMIKSGYFISKGICLRKHIFSMLNSRMLIKYNINTFIFAFSLFLSLYKFYLFSLYLMALLFRWLFIKKDVNTISFYLYIYYNVMIDISVLFGFIRKSIRK